MTHILSSLGLVIFIYLHSSVDVYPGTRIIQNVCLVITVRDNLNERRITDQPLRMNEDVSKKKSNSVLEEI